MDSRTWEGVSSGSGRGKPAVETLDFGYIEKCTNKRQLEHILITLRSGEEGWYPDLTQFCEKKLETVAPESRVLHPTKPAVYVSELHGPQRHTIETELEEWQEAMQACAEHLGGDWSCLFEDKLPPVRSKGDVAKSKELPEACGLQKSRKTCHIRSTDYSAWDKFDVDKECEQIDLEPQARKAEKTAMNLDLPKLEQSVNTAALSDVEKWLVAEREKNKGNEALRAMDYTEAVAYYTRSISALPTTAAFNNRALAKLKLEQWHGTVQDCDHVLSLQPRNVKAFLRRCTALRSLGQLQEAQEDAFQALQIEPGHKQAQKLLHDIEKLAVNTGVEVQRLQGRWLEVTDVGRTHNGDHDCNKHSASLDKLASVSQQDHPNLMYQKCEDDDNVLVTLIPKINEHRGTKLIVEMDKNERCEQSESVTSDSSFQENDQLTLSSNMINIHTETAQECDDCGKVEQDAREKQSQTSNYDSEIEVPHPIKSSVSAARKQYLNAKTMVETEEPSSLCSTNVTTELSTFEFGQHWQWHVSKGDICGVAALLQGVSPSHIPVLLGNKLEGAGVGCALHALRHLVNIQPDLAYQLLLYLTRTPRFQLVSMFLSEDERKAGEELLEELDCASATAEYGKYDVASLRRILDLA